MGTIKLPGAFQIDDVVIVDLGVSGAFNGVITKVHFDPGKITYDLSVDYSFGPIGNERHTTRIHNIDSAFVFPNDAENQFRMHDHVSFGSYLLSDERTKRISDNWDPKDSVPLSERLKSVYHADVENWKEIKRQERLNYTKAPAEDVDSGPVSGSQVVDFSLDGPEKVTPIA